MPLYPGHEQPLHPLDDNYYDLTDPEALIWQANIANQYGVGGFVFFHYWFSGKLLLERPVELWRNTPDADLGYCLCWANHDWTRTWDGKGNQMLQAQTYGGRDDWDRHLDYLLPFFEDPRYIQQDGKPVLFLYNASDVPDVNSMVRHWQDRLVEAGFAGIHIVEYVSSKNPRPHCSLSAAVYEDEPLYSLRFEIPLRAKAKRFVVKRLLKPDYQDYNDVWRRMLRKRRRYDGREIIQGAFVGWDNSPRRGAKGPVIVRGSSPVSFEKHLRALVASGRPDASQNFLVVNSWNEWGEGAILEPSKEKGFGYLEAVRRVLGAVHDPA
ncbi:Uncharacterised protein [Mycolicibacterium aurum]|uniref:Lipopolysaccharide biosynthesis protein n=1 Tax=Mycolicibacterium aurum TaxID=1791 RepID=A0A3S4RZ36_MYCAU|nr:Uncharacterised protein [Mycolicibacterium aurum]